jgi:hypothetical protein
MTTTEHTYRTEADAHAARRELINQGLSVSLIAFDPARNVYAFDAHDVFGDQVGAVVRRARQAAPPRLHLAAPRAEFTVCGLVAAEQDTTVMPERTTCANCQHEVAVDPRGIAAEMRLA